MKSWKKGVLFGVVIVLAVGGAYGYNYIKTSVPIATAYTVKILCSSVFISGREEGDVLRKDLEIVPKYMVKAEIDHEKKMVSASFLGLYKRTAVFREGLGCTVCNGVDPEDLRGQTVHVPESLSKTPIDASWPDGEHVSVADLPYGIDQNKLNQALDKAFQEIAPEKPLRTWAVVVVYKGRIAGERYAEGFTSETPLLGWSMTKSVNSALIGILVKQQKLDLKAPAPVPEWQAGDDPRSKITLDQLMRMSSGLRFIEEYEDNVTSDCIIMLYRKRDMGAYAASKPLEAGPDEKWSYSSGTANILARIVRQTVGGSDRDYYAFPREALFQRIGMQSAVMEPDASGTFVGSSYMYATARDWARFGLLYLQDGVWEGERILPEGWVRYSRTPEPKSPAGEKYGAQFWLNAGGKERWLPDLPADLYAACGHDGQYLLIIPSRDTVVVRLGLSRGPESDEILAFVSDVLKALPE